MSYKNFTIKLFHAGNINHIDKDHSGQKNVFFMPMGIYALAHELSKNNFDVEVIHSDLISEKDFFENLNLDNVNAIGMDCHWVNQSYNVISYAKAIKKINPHIYVFIGGFTASYFANEILDTLSDIDFIVKGDGEVPIVELCNVLKATRYENCNVKETIRNLYKVSNLVFRDNHSIVSGKEKYVANSAQLENLGFAKIDYLRNWKNYKDLCHFWTQFSQINTKHLFFLETGRGCIYNCSFCGGNSYAQKCINERVGQIVRSVESVKETINEAWEYGYDLFYSCFEFEKSDDWYIKLLKKLEHKISFGYGCWSLPSKKIIDALSDYCEEVIIELSPETADDELRKTNKDMRLYYSNQELVEILDYISLKPNVKVQLYFGYFLPFDNEDTVKRTMEFIIEIHRKYYNFVECIYNNLSTDPGSLLFINPDKFKVDISVRSFSDYLNEIKKSYSNINGAPKDLSLFRPKGMDNILHERLSKFLYLFNFCLSNYQFSLCLVVNQCNIPEFINKLENFKIDTYDNFKVNVLVKEFISDLCCNMKNSHQINDILNSEYHNNILPYGVKKEISINDFNDIVNESFENAVDQISDIEINFNM